MSVNISDGRLFNTGRLLRIRMEEGTYPLLSWEDYTEEITWTDWVAQRDPTPHQIHLIKKGFDDATTMETTWDGVPSDSDPFPYGKQKGMPYGKVSPKYFLWALEQPWIEKWPRVLAYIKKHENKFKKRLDETTEMLQDIADSIDKIGNKKSK